MRPPELRRLLRDDIDLTTDEGIDQLFDVINLFMEQTNLAFNGNLTIGDNITGRVLETTFTTPATYPTDFDAVTVPWAAGGFISAVLVGYVVMTDSATTIITDAVQVTSWSQSAASLKLNFVSGLTASTRYTLRLVVL